MSDKRSESSEWPSELRLDASGGPAPYIKRAKADALISAVLDQAGYGAAPAPAFREEPRVHAPYVADLPRHRAHFAAGSAAAIALFAFLGMGSASAAVMWYVRERSPVQQPVVTQPIPQSAPAQKPKRVAPARVEAPRPEPIELPPQVLESARPKVERRAPEDWLNEGNRLRAERRWHKADEAYASALRSAPRSQVAYVARVASAAVKLEHLEDAEGALALYHSALRDAPNGTLREEVLFGIADAERALGHRSEERAALERFLREYPESALAEQAKRRLE